MMHIKFLFKYGAPDGKLRAFPYRTLVYKDLADVVCEFVLREHEARRLVPVGICKRPGCGNPVARFKKRQYCRTEACDREGQKRDSDLAREKNRDNVFLCRLRKKPRPARLKEAREKVERLREIESYWRGRNDTLAKHALKLLDEVR